MIIIEVNTSREQFSNRKIFSLRVSFNVIRHIYIDKS